MGRLGPRGTDLAVVTGSVGRSGSNIRSARSSTRRPAGSAGPRLPGRFAGRLHRPPGAGDDGDRRHHRPRGQEDGARARICATCRVSRGRPRREVWFTAARQGDRREVYAVSTAGKMRLVRTNARDISTLLTISPDRTPWSRNDDYRAGVLASLPGETKERDLAWLDWSARSALSADGKTLLFDESGEGAGARYRFTCGEPTARRRCASATGRRRRFRRTGHGRLTRTGLRRNSSLVPDRRRRSRDSFRRTASATRHTARFCRTGRASPSWRRSRATAPVSMSSRSTAARPSAISARGANQGRIFISPDSERIVGDRPRSKGLHLSRQRRGRAAISPASETHDDPAGWTADGKGLYVRRRSGQPCRVDLIDVASAAGPTSASSRGRMPPASAPFGPAPRDAGWRDHTRTASRGCSRRSIHRATA